MTTVLRDCPAPAKLNLFLHVNGRRADGYHLLQTVFQLVDHGDLLHFALRADHAIVRTSDVPGVAAADDLTVRALRLLQDAYLARHGRLPPGIDVAIDKRLPLGGGLGGGSSDAATALLAANYLWQAGLERTELMTLGLRLGADVPFFIFGQSAFAEGVGEALRPVDTPACWYLVIEPGVAVPTAAVFCDADLTRDTKPVRIADFSRRLKDRHDPTMSGKSAMFGRNDLQAVARRLFPPVAQALDWLSGYGEARMTGSGACVFCAFASESEADAVLLAVPDAWRGWKAQALSHHPLRSLLRSGAEVE